jgi:hypothetical protein
MVIAFDNARRRQGVMTFLLRIETISESLHGTKLARRNGRTSSSGNR